MVLKRTHSINKKNSLKMFRIWNKLVILIYLGQWRLKWNKLWNYLLKKERHERKKFLNTKQNFKKVKSKCLKNKINIKLKSKKLFISGNKIHRSIKNSMITLLNKIKIMIMKQNNTKKCVFSYKMNKNN